MNLILTAESEVNRAIVPATGRDTLAFGIIMSENNTSTTVSKNGLTFTLVREETKAKAGKEATCYWNIPAGSVLAGLTDAEKAAMIKDIPETGMPAEQTAAYEKVLTAYKTLLGVDKIVEYIVARLDIAMRMSQLDGGKDVWTMEEKITKAVDYIGKGDFGRNRQGGVAVLADKNKRLQELASKQAELLRESMAASQAMAVAKTDAEKAAAQAKLLDIMARMQALAN